mmetsp:Transcript_9693/g.9768  ORF Transcript_9693/g.9768 Transcript_9693/m.9768 type:complete len:624 (+) Transcript_9693:151-2022(+)
MRLVSEKTSSTLTANQPKRRPVSANIATRLALSRRQAITREQLIRDIEIFQRRAHPTLDRSGISSADSPDSHSQKSSPRAPSNHRQRPQTAGPPGLHRGKVGYLHTLRTGFIPSTGGGSVTDAEVQGRASSPSSPAGRRRDSSDRDRRSSVNTENIQSLKPFASALDPVSRESDAVVEGSDNQTAPSSPADRKNHQEIDGDSKKEDKPTGNYLTSYYSSDCIISPDNNPNGRPENSGTGEKEKEKEIETAPVSAQPGHGDEGQVQSVPRPKRVLAADIYPHRRMVLDTIQMRARPDLFTETDSAQYEMFSVRFVDVGLLVPSEELLPPVEQLEVPGDIIATTMGIRVEATQMNNPLITCRTFISIIRLKELISGGIKRSVTSEKDSGKAIIKEEVEIEMKSTDEQRQSSVNNKIQSERKDEEGEEGEEVIEQERDDSDHTYQSNADNMQEKTVEGETEEEYEEEEEVYSDDEAPTPSESEMGQSALGSVDKSGKDKEMSKSNSLKSMTRSSSKSLSHALSNKSLQKKPSKPRMRIADILKEELDGLEDDEDDENNANNCHDVGYSYINFIFSGLPIRDKENGLYDCLSDVYNEVIIESLLEAIIPHIRVLQTSTTGRARIHIV